MHMEYNEFQDILNKRLFEGSKKDLLEKISENPDRFVGLFRPTKPKTKLIQNITQSHEIRFGSAIEEVFSTYFERAGFRLLPGKIVRKSGKELAIDQLIEKEDIVYIIEQKLRDDHDSTKKISQFDNFEVKYNEVSELHSNKNVKPIMWFIDDSLVKNKGYYISEMIEMKKDYSCEPSLCYGKELFDNNVIPSLSYDIWEEIISHLKHWKDSLPDMPELNFDIDSAGAFMEIKDLSTNVYRKLFTNNEIMQHILPILFPSGETLALLKKHFSALERPIYATLVKYIDSYMNRYQEAL